jgi:hypothetical protein
VGLLLLLAAAVDAAALDLISGDLDRRLPLAGLTASGDASTLAAGDFNGDGRDDLVLGVGGAGFAELRLLPGGEWADGDAWGGRPTWRIFVPVPPYGFAQADFADLNGDGRRDLLIRSLVPYDVARGRLWAFWGGDSSRPDVDLRQDAADVEFLLSSAALSLSAGDWDGDGREDLLLGSWPKAPATLLWGRDDFPAVLSSTSPAWSLSLEGLTTVSTSPLDLPRGMTTALTDMDGDGRKDAVIAFSDTSWGVPAAGFIYWGRGYRPTGSVDLRADTTTFRLTAGSSFDLVAAVDLTGDGAGDAYVRQGTRTWLLDGAGLRSAGAVDLASVGTLARPIDALEGQSIQWADFDGDGANDVLTRPNGNHAHLRLSSGGPYPDFLSAAGLNVTHFAASAVFGDFDGDARQDLALVQSWPTDADGRNGSLSVLYGFRPFGRPRLTIDDETSGSAVRSASLSARGDAVEMRLDGDVRDPLPGVWVPYAPTFPVSLSSAAGDKSVRATLRTRRGRESETVSAVGRVSLAEDSLRTRRNRVRPGDPAAWELSTHGGRFEAAVYATNGARVVTLDRGDRPAGVYPLRWDGRNAAGEYVGEGIYQLLVQDGDTRHRRRILVEEP